MFRSWRVRMDRRVKAGGDEVEARLEKTLPLQNASGLQKTLEFLLEARHPAATVEHLLLAAGPGRMRLRVDVEMQRVARLPQVVRLVNSAPLVMTTLMVW